MAISADLGARLDSVIATLVASGRYNSKSEVLREGVRLVEEREKRLLALDEAIQQGRDQADSGELVSAEAVFAELRNRYSDKDRVV